MHTHIYVRMYVCMYAMYAMYVCMYSFLYVLTFSVSASKSTRCQPADKQTKPPQFISSPRLHTTSLQTTLAPSVTHTHSHTQKPLDRSTKRASHSFAATACV